MAAAGVAVHLDGDVGLVAAAAANPVVPDVLNFVPRVMRTDQARHLSLDANKNPALISTDSTNVMTNAQVLAMGFPEAIR